MPHKVTLWSISCILLLTCIRLSNGRLQPQPDKCLDDGFFCFEVVGRSAYAYQIQAANDARRWFQIYAERTGQAVNDFYTHAWNISLHPTIDEADLYLDWKAVGERWPKIKIEVQKLPNSIVTFNFLKWDPAEKALKRLQGGQIWRFFRNLDPQGHSFSFETSEYLDQELGFESRKLTLRLRGNITREDGKPVNHVVDFITDDGAHMIFGDRSDLRPLYEQTSTPHPPHPTHDHDASATSTTEKVVQVSEEHEVAENKTEAEASSAHAWIMAGIALAALLFAAIVFALYKWLH